MSKVRSIKVCSINDHKQIEGVPIGQHPLVSTLLKGVHNSIHCQDIPTHGMRRWLPNTSCRWVPYTEVRSESETGGDNGVGAVQ